ncbi:MAG TPA: phosphoadenylyl-sulfate reductase [Burkholderiales bacterium]
MGIISEKATNTAGLSPEEIAVLNAKYAPLGFEDRIRELYRDFAPDKILVTSSFAATSAYFLHIISRIRPEQEIAFIDTGFHFPETLHYKRYLTERFGLKVVDEKAEDWKHEFTEREKVHASDPDLCCSINKVEPLEAIKFNYHVWVSSLMRWQTEHRAGLEILEERRGILKFNPMLDVTREERDAYIREHGLPFHPLVAKGYASIGCTHCTSPGAGRAGRWVDKPKTECGLHL